MSKTYEVKIGTTELSDLTKFEVERNKLFADADRNLAGDLKATFIGIFPKITIGFNYMTEAQVKTILGLLEPASISVTWWDSKSGTYKTGDFYASDPKPPYWSKEKGMYAPWEVNLIAYKKI